MSTPPFTPAFVNPSEVPLEPTVLRAGDSWNWHRYFPEYASGDGWKLQYILNAPTLRFAFPAGTIAQDIDAIGFDVALAGAQTAAIGAGTYECYAVLSNTALGLQQTFALQSVQVQPNLATASGAVDTRSFVKKTLDALEAAILGDASPLVQEYEIHGRLVKYMDRLQLKALRDQFKQEYRTEQIANGEYTRKHRVGIFFKPSS